MDESRARRRRNLRRSLIVVLIAAGLMEWAFIASRHLPKNGTPNGDEGPHLDKHAADIEGSARAEAVVARWSALAEDLRAIEACTYDTANITGGEEAARVRAWEAVLQFRESTPLDASSQATMKAFLGWANRLGGSEDKGLKEMREAAELDPELPYGSLMEGFACFSDYFASPDLPVVAHSQWGPATGLARVETEEEKELRTRMERLFDRAASASHTGAEMADDIRGLIGAMRALQENRFEDAEVALTTALGSPYLQVIRTDLRLARAEVRYLSGDFGGARSDIEWVSAVRPRQRKLSCLLELIRWGEGLDWVANDGRQLVRDLPMGVLNVDAKNLPQELAGWLGRGMALVGLAKAEMHGRKASEESLRKGIESFRGALNLAPGDRAATLCLGHALTMLADYQSRRGIEAPKEYDEAIACFTDLLRKDGGSSEIYCARGLAYKGKADSSASVEGDPREGYRNAIDDFVSALSREPANPKARLNLGVARFRLGDAEAARGVDPTSSYAQGVFDLEEVVRRDPKALSVWMERGNAIEAVARWDAAHGKDSRPLHDRAIHEYGMAIGADPTSADAHVRRALAWEARGDAEAAKGADARDSFRHAINDFEAALETTPHDAQALNGCGLAWKGLGDAMLAAKQDPSDVYEKARFEFGQAADADPYHADAWLNRGRTWLAVAKLQTSKKRNPRPSDDKAIEDLNESVLLNVSNCLLWNNLAEAKAQRGDHEAEWGGDPTRWWNEAVADFGRSLARKPDQPLLVERVKQIKARLGK